MASKTEKNKNKGILTFKCFISSANLCLEYIRILSEIMFLIYKTFGLENEPLLHNEIILEQWHRTWLRLQNEYL